MLVNLELKTPGELLDEVIQLRKALERIARLSEPEARMDDSATGDFAKRIVNIARKALALPNGEQK